MIPEKADYFSGGISLSTHKHIDRICGIVLVCTLVLTVLFMNGEALGLQKVVDQDAERNSDSVYFTEYDLDGAWDASSPTATITLTGDGAKISGKGAYANGGTVTITGAGRYVLTGELTDGAIVVDAYQSSKIWLLLDGVAVENSSGPALWVKQADKVFVTLAAGTENTLTDGAAYSAEATADGADGAVFSHDDLTFNGSGSLTVTGNYKHGIAANDDLVLAGGELTVTAAADGVRANDSLRLCEAAVTVNAGDDGVMAANEEEGQGWLYVESGRLTITAGDDAVHTAGDITVDGGEFTIAAGDDGIHSDTAITLNGGTVLIEECYEGLEAVTIDMTGGDVTIYPEDDGFNANGGSGGFGMMGGGMGGFGQQPDGEGSMPQGGFGQWPDGDGSMPQGGFGQQPDGDGSMPQGGFGQQPDGDGSMPQGGFGQQPDGEGSMPQGGFGQQPDGDGSLPQGGFGQWPDGDGSLPQGGFGQQPDGDGSLPQGGFGQQPDGNGSMPEALGESGLPQGDDPLTLSAAENTAQAESQINISGGSVTIINETGRDADGLDSNGSISISGGEIRISLVNSGSNCAIDYGSESGGVCEISGGTVIACGSYSMAEGFDASSTQASVLYNFSAGAQAGTTVALEDADGNVLLSWAVPCTFSSANLSCPAMTVGGTYQVVVGDQAEEITLEETSASFGDAASSMFGGMNRMGQGGGMQMRGSFGGQGSQGETASSGDAADSATQSPPGEPLEGQPAQGGFDRGGGRMLFALLEDAQGITLGEDGSVAVTQEGAQALLEALAQNGQEVSATAEDLTACTTLEELMNALGLSMGGGRGGFGPGGRGGFGSQGDRESSGTESSAQEPPALGEEGSSQGMEDGSRPELPGQNGNSQPGEGDSSASGEPGAPEESKSRGTREASDTAATEDAGTSADARTAVWDLPGETWLGLGLSAGVLLVGLFIALVFRRRHNG